MKKILFPALVAFGAWGYYTKNGDALPHIFQIGTHSTTTGKQQQYQCDGRQYCSQMKSYEEARFFIENCPDAKMDGDHDGIPCERQFRR